MTTEYQPAEIRVVAGRPVAVGDQPLAAATRVVRTGTGFWGLFAAGDRAVLVHPAGAFSGRPEEVRDRLEGMLGQEGLDAADREAAASFLPFLGADDPGAARQAPRSRVQAGVPPTYWLSDVTNSPPGVEPEPVEPHPG